MNPRVLRRHGVRSDVYIVSNKANIRIHHDGDRWVRRKSRPLGRCYQVPRNGSRSFPPLLTVADRPFEIPRHYSTKRRLTIWKRRITFSRYWKILAFAKRAARRSFGAWGVRVTFHSKILQIYLMMKWLHVLLFYTF